MPKRLDLLANLTREQRRRIDPEATNPGAIARSFELNADAGHHFYEDGALRFFDSMIHDVFEGPGGVILVDSIQFQGSERFETQPRRYKVRRQKTEGKHRGAFDELAEFTTRAEALVYAIWAAETEGSQIV